MKRFGDFLAALEWVSISATIACLIYAAGYLWTVERKVVGISNAGAVQFKPIPVIKGNVAQQLFRPALVLERLARPRYWSGWYLTTNSNGSSRVYLYDVARREK